MHWFGAWGRGEVSLVVGRCCGMVTGSFAALRMTEIGCWGGRWGRDWDGHSPSRLPSFLRASRVNVPCPYDFLVGVLGFGLMGRGGLGRLGVGVVGV